MTIPFKDLTDTQPSGTVGYLRFLPRAVGDLWFGALFVMNARGEPVEFTYSRIRAPKTLLWRPADAHACCVRSMCAAMFETCPSSPVMILCLASEVDPDVFAKDLSIDLPVGRVFDSEDLSDIKLDWIVPPEAGSRAKRLFDALHERGLLTEPFARAETGLREVYSELLQI
ncbi:MAG: hypothetical protein ACYC64_00085 [Armatimonadota bacterium]